MQKEIAAEIRKEIRKEEQKVLLAYVGLKKYSPSRLAEKVAKIRNLRDLLSGLVDATKEFLTGLYLKWVRRES
jgi:predicted component of type VI protein secretion system